MEDREGYRVHRVLDAREIPTSKGPISERAEARSRFPAGSQSPLPAVVETHKSTGTLRETRAEETVTAADLSARPDAGLFGLAGLALPKGERVSDQRVGRAAGYWNGQQLVDRFTEARQGVGRPPPAEPARRWWPAAVAGLVVVLGAAVWWVRRR